MNSELITAFGVITGGASFIIVFLIRTELYKMRTREKGFYSDKQKWN